MKKFTIGFVALLAMALAISGVAVATGPGPKATGGGKALVTAGPNIGNEVTFGFNAQGEGDASDGKGRVNILVEQPDGTFVQHFNGSVNCYSQSGDFAVFTGQVKVLRLGTSPNTGQFFQVRVFDGGEPGTDLMDFRRDANPLDCESGPPIFPVTEGNIQVHQPNE